MRPIMQDQERRILSSICPNKFIFISSAILPSILLEYTTQDLVNGKKL
jgi:hypothetical protein